MTLLGSEIANLLSIGIENVFHEEPTAESASSNVLG